MSFNYFKRRCEWERCNVIHTHTHTHTLPTECERATAASTNASMCGCAGISPPCDQRHFSICCAHFFRTRSYRCFQINNTRMTPGTRNETVATNVGSTVQSCGDDFDKCTWSADLWTADAVSWIQSTTTANVPWFLYLACVAPSLFVSLRAQVLLVLLLGWSSWSTARIL